MSWFLHCRKDQEDANATEIPQCFLRKQSKLKIVPIYFYAALTFYQTILDFYKKNLRLTNLLKTLWKK